jgi:hypothetical protein
VWLTFSCVSSKDFKQARIVASRRPWLAGSFVKQNRPQHRVNDFQEWRSMRTDQPMSRRAQPSSPMLRDNGRDVDRTHVRAGNIRGEGAAVATAQPPAAGGRRAFRAECSPVGLPCSDRRIPAAAKGPVAMRLALGLVVLCGAPPAEPDFGLSQRSSMNDRFQLDTSGSTPPGRP